jgi:hypothetical protein
MMKSDSERRAEYEQNPVAQVVTPVKAEVQKSLKDQDSGFCRNDGNSLISGTGIKAIVNGIVPVRGD